MKRPSHMFCHRALSATTAFSLVLGMLFCASTAWTDEPATVPQAQQELERLQGKLQVAVEARAKLTDTLRASPNNPETRERLTFSRRYMDSLLADIASTEKRMQALKKAEQADTEFPALVGKVSAVTAYGQPLGIHIVLGIIEEFIKWTADILVSKF